ncbi:putative leader peptide [Streptomyces sp. DSM 110735]|uniref:putative leader peptide n=1 Tax=Streptomyces sp. DSM 110735 TaxID=2775031 RepID=UPI0035A98C72
MSGVSGTPSGGRALALMTRREEPQPEGVGEMPQGLDRVPCPRLLRTARSVLLHSRPHIDLQRVAGALCRA